MELESKVGKRGEQVLKIILAREITKTVSLIHMEEVFSNNAERENS